MDYKTVTKTKRGKEPEILLDETNLPIEPATSGDHKWFSVRTVLGVTKNLGNFESLKFEVGCEHPYETDKMSKDKAILDQTKWIETVFKNTLTSFLEE